MAVQQNKVKFDFSQPVKAATKTPLTQIPKPQNTAIKSAPGSVAPKRFSFGAPVTGVQSPSSQPQNAAINKTEVPTGPAPELTIPGVTTYANYKQAMEKLEQAGFEFDMFAHEMICLSGHFANIEYLGKSETSPCKVHIREARLSRPRPKG